MRGTCRSRPHRKSRGIEVITSPLVGSGLNRHAGRYMSTQRKTASELPPLTGVCNFRGLGGLQTVDDRRVRQGVVFRSAGLCELTPEDVAVISGQLGVKTVIDLRTDIELERDGVGPLKDVRRVQLPLIHDDGQGGSDPSRQREGGLAARYLSYLDMAATAVVGALDVLADPNNHPVIIHCSAGKDRTGVMVAMLLDTLRVSEQDIIEDYVRSHPHRDKVVAYLRRRPAYEKLMDRMPEFALDAEPETMREFLAAIRRKHGGVGALLHAHGMSTTTADALRQALLERPAN